MNKAKYRKIENKPIFQQIIDQIRHQISQGNLKPGDRLPPEREFSKIMSANRHTMREALKVHEYIGLVHGKTGVWTVINNIGQDVLVDRMAFEAKFLSKQFLLVELMELRKLLEPGIVALAAERATDEEFAVMGQRWRTSRRRSIRKESGMPMNGFTVRLPMEPTIVSW
jgi:GntR family transcriptional regulator, transcriptional repressor for pyruvate dehydrogenase complex